jgi:plastocyanin
MRGKDINIPKGTQFNAYVDGDREIALGGASAAMTVQTTQSAPAAQSVSAVGNGAALTSISLTVSSSPSGADITIDGKFMGSTPSSLQVGAGDHTVTIEKLGFKTWQRTVTLTAGSSPTINATLEKK